MLACLRSSPWFPAAVDRSRWEREHGQATSPLHSPKPPLNRENVKVLLEY